MNAKEYREAVNSGKLKAPVEAPKKWSRSAKGTAVLRLYGAAYRVYMNGGEK